MKQAYLIEPCGLIEGLYFYKMTLFLFQAWRLSFTINGYYGIRTLKTFFSSSLESFNTQWSECSNIFLIYFQEKSKFMLRSLWESIDEQNIQDFP